MEHQECVAIIPARGGSKGIVHKNLRQVAGRPLLGHTVLAAMQAERVSRVVVSTDDPALAEVAEQFGASVVWRPPAIAGDKASSESALLHVLDSLADEGYRPELMAFLQCTSPLTAAADIDGTLAALEEQGADTALAVAPFHYFVWSKDAEGNASGINHDKSVRQLRQDREPQYLETGAVYAMKVDGFREHQHRFFGRTVVHEMPLERVWEIDDPVDLDIAEVLMRVDAETQLQHQLPDPVAAVVMDFDGVFTDNRVVVDQHGVESVQCHRGDGMGLEMLRNAGVPLLVLSKERNPVVAARCEKLQIPCHHGVDGKLALLRSWAQEHGHDLANLIYVGNDVNDVECLQAVGCGVAVADAHPTAQRAARILLRQGGGRGALRELSDLLLEARFPAEKE